ncbi:autophagy-related protein 2 homolog A [Drosophila tropicalis]|uniref:autophagy-related protein 2 homolog A n=1 Tax=Drosophila tropicalis TaxID=46794 RepID=UPI0035AB7896
MSWFSPWDGLKTKTCRYLLQRYLGQFFENNLNLEQLKVDLYNGKAVVKDISLKVNAFNDLFEDQGWAFEVVSGHIGCLSVVVPWNALMTNDSSLEISDLTITLRPVTRLQSGTTMLESMWSSVSSSMQMAEECMKQVDDDVPFHNPNNALIGLEKFAETIDNVLNRINAKLTNTTLNIEYVLPNSARKLIISFKANHLDYKNKTGYEQPSRSSSASDNPRNRHRNHSNSDDDNGDGGHRDDSHDEYDDDDDGRNVEPDDNHFNALPMIAKHNLVIKGLSIHTSETIDYDDDCCPTRYGQLCKIVEFNGSQNIQISIKQTENIIGPKINLEIILDDIFFMLTPRQIHLFIEFSKGFTKERPKDQLMKKCRTIKPQPQSHQAPNEYPNSKMTGILGQNVEWSSEAHLDDYSTYSTYNKTSAMSTATSRNTYGTRGGRKMCESIASSSNSMLTSCTNAQTEIGYAETSGEILKFKIQISQIYGLALHNDILITTTANIDDYRIIFDPSSYDRYVDIADNYFLSTSSSSATGQIVTDHTKRLPLQNQNYLFVKASPIIINGNQQRYCQELTSKTTLSATMVDLCEVLDNQMDHLILFDRRKNCPDGYHIRPEIVLTQSSSFLYKQNSNRCTNKLECIFDECTTDLDISIYDRLSALFGRSPFVQGSNANEILLDEANQTELYIKCELLKLQLRFPIVDGRSEQDPQKIPWWKKNVRKDFLALELRNVLVNLTTNISINADEIDAFYCETDDMRNAVHLAKCKQRAINANRKIRIDIFQLESNNNDMMINNKRKPKRKSPFSSKCPFGYTSNVEGLEGHTEKTDSFLPGETEEVNDFCDSCTQSSKLKIEAYIPQTKIVLQSKKIYEIIYNRLNGDLFMWEPRSPYYEETPEEEQQGHGTRGNAENLCSSAIDDYEERNILLSTSTLESSIYFSMAEPTLPQSSSSCSSSGRAGAGAGATDPTLKKIKPRDDAFSFEAIIEEGCLILFAPVRDSDNVVGKFQINLKELKLFTVTGLNNDKNLGYFCIQLKQIEALHCGNTSIQDVHLAWSDQIDPNLMPTIYNYPQVHHSSSNKRQEVLSIVAEIKKQPEKRIKRMKMSFGINGAILRHNPAYSEHIWLNQLIDFMDVTDYPIEAYEPYALVSEIQLHVWNAAIDYRPKFFTYRAFIDIGYCTLSTNIISSMTGCTLRIIAEDCVLNMGLIEAAGSGEDCCDILIPVLNLGLLNISFRLNDDNNRIHPAVDLRSSIHDMHLRTCYDSAAALAQLIAYVANDKDIISIDENTTLDDSDEHSFSDPKLNEKDNCDQTQIHVNKLMAEAVKDVETIPGKHIQKQSKRGEEGIEIFYFPDEPNEKPVEYHKRSSSSSVTSQSPLSPSKYKTLENREPEICNILDFESNVMLQSYYNQTKSQISLPQVQEDLGALTSANSSLEEKDFDIIHDDEILPMDKFGVKQIYVSEDPLQIVDNHFCLPHEKVDLLRPPANFPIPEHSYTLCEMTFTWHMFGGKDFPDRTANEQSKMKKNPVGGAAASPASGMSETYKYGVSQPQNEFDKKSKKSTLKEPKGSKRNMDVLVEIQLSKIRFSYEIYPTNSIYSSRQVLLISEIEIRDRLRSSEINKFLYHPNINNISHKPDENMVIVKALSIRPNPQKNSAEECSLRVSILPIKLNIDQDTLLFLEDFFSAVFKNSTATSSSGGSPKMDSNSSAERDMPVMSVNKIPEELEDSEVKELVERNLDVLIDESKEDKDAVEYGEDAASNEVSPVYFREVIFSPALPICFDYHGRRIELSRGPITGLIMGLAQLQGSGICLREIVNRRGILGWNKLFEYLCREWLKDIKRNQLPNILSGIGPTNAVLQLFQGVYDLFRLPIEQYNKDGRIIRGFQLGAQSFTARTALAALEITSRIIHLLQFTAETTFDMLSAGPSLKKRNTKHGKKRQGRPKDLREGVANAYAIVKEGINDSANTLIEAAITEHDQKGYSGAVGAVVRQIPQLVVCPAVLATQATTNILGGAKSSLIPEAKLEARDKWKHELH